MCVRVGEGMIEPTYMRTAMQACKQASMQAGRSTYIEAGRHVGIHTGWQADGFAIRHASKQASISRGRYIHACRQMGKREHEQARIYSQTGMHPHIQTYM